MKLVSRLLFVVSFGCIFNTAFSQDKAVDYIIKDTVYSMGIVMPLSKVSIQFKKNKNTEPDIYFAYDIKEYSYNGKIYESIRLPDGKLTFIERIASGKAKLYKTGNLYALQVDSIPTFFSRKDFRSVLHASIKCEGNDNSISKLAYSRMSLRNYVNSFNQGNCNLDNFPHKKIGIYVGYNFFQSNASFGNSSNQKGNISSPTIGLFFDMPIKYKPSFFLTTELNWLSGEPQYYSEDQNNSYYLGATIKGVNSLISAKWVFSQRKIKSYVKAGGLVSFLNISSPTGQIETITKGSAIDISYKEVSESSAVLYGFSSGLGLEIPIKKRMNFHVETRYLKSFNGYFDSFSMNFSGFSVVAGFNL